MKYKIKKQKKKPSYFIKEPYGLPFELTEKGKYTLGYQGKGLYDKDDGAFVEKISYEKMMKKYGDVPDGLVWEGSKNDWKETFEMEKY